MAAVKDILSIAAKEIGTKESPANSNKQKYGVAYKWNGVPWCVIFQWWVFKEAGASSLFYGGGKTASCSELISYAKSHGQWVTSGYRPGDLCFFEFTGDSKPDHVGLVESVSSAIVISIEGNTSSDDSGSQSNGGMVCRKKRSKSIITGAYRPSYEAVSKPSTAVKTVSVPCQQLANGNTGGFVETLQILLNAKSGSKLSIDGEFGPATEAAVRKFQAAHKSECGSADGIVGTKTWAALLS